jgi:hypothetical protein
MTDFVLFRHKSTGVVASYPEHYAEHPVFGYDLEPYDPENTEFEEDKVVSEDHNLPVEQRGTVVAKPLEEFTVPELQDIARENGLTTSGTKTELISRITEHDEDNE